MTRSIRRASLFCLLLVLALMVRVTWIAVAKADSYDKNPANARNTIDRYADPLGNILVGGQPVTGSKAGGGSLAYQRTYADGPLYAPVTGYSSQAYGSTQLENLYGPLLDGSDPRLASPFAALTRDRPAGGDVVTSIDPAVQQAAWNALGGKQGAAVAIDPDTGRILALVSTPSWDPNRITGRSAADAAAWKQLSADNGSAMLNSALRSTYAPGSTFKLVTLAAALENGLYSDVDQPTDSPDPYTLPGTRTVLTNENPSAPCTNASLRTALEYSCNNVFAKVAADLGETKMAAQAAKFGFGLGQLDVPVRAAESVYPSGMEKSQVALTGIGQFSVTATPLQMAMVSAAVANGGVLMKPSMVEKLTDHSGRTVQEFGPARLDQVMSKRTADQIHSAMVSVVTAGTGRAAAVKGLTVGGKTGTAQNGIDNSGIPYAWFTSFAEDGSGKRIATAVVVLDGSADRDAVTGGGLAGPVSKAMAQAYLKR
ncbi:penicillin-binding protein 2 [Kitasatospora sp. MMS16-BH015]|uniref:peptidoglycan D,D-transpeptidase FtsI family protein n=1 Tax=Kitasatospora sp. MMS16-BH015 TaxID=2018025 RepID=UPI000CF28CA3|nr:penicillin-binding transpeptidase domain-containing protein [Kitasatospora sp. MMS16-BH015]